MLNSLCKAIHKAGCVRQCSSAAVKQIMRQTGTALAPVLPGIPLPSWRLRKYWRRLGMWRKTLLVLHTKSGKQLKATPLLLKWKVNVTHAWNTKEIPEEGSPRTSTTQVCLAELGALAASSLTVSVYTYFHAFVYKVCEDTWRHYFKWRAQGMLKRQTWK